MSVVAASHAEREGVAVDGLEVVGEAVLCVNDPVICGGGGIFISMGGISDGTGAL